MPTLTPGHPVARLANGTIIIGLAVAILGVAGRVMGIWSRQAMVTTLLIGGGLALSAVPIRRGASKLDARPAAAYTRPPWLTILLTEGAAVVALLTSAFVLRSVLPLIVAIVSQALLLL